MPTRVKFRFNKVTGEVEEFLVDDQDRRLPEAEHDRIASDVGRLIAENPRIIEVPPGQAQPNVPLPEGKEPETEDERRREGQS